jgi:hypothetical protein
MAIDVNDKATQQLIPVKRGRGRPKTNPDDKTTQLRKAQKALKDRRLAEGSQRVSLWLTKESADAVQTEMNKTGCGKEEAVNRLILGKH